MPIATRQWAIGLLGGLCWSCLSATTAFAQPDTKPLKKALGVQSEIQVYDRSSQRSIDALHGQISTLLDQYKELLQERESLTVYNDQIAVMVTSQEEEITSLRDQIGTIDQTSRDIVPLILRMTEALAAFIDLDAPFLLAERKQRLADVRTNMDRADITVSEKYRQLMEAYQVEGDYGRTIEAYTDKLDDRTVDFLRIGRISLMYRTLDGKEVGHWDRSQRSWQVLEDGYKNAIDRGLKIARKQAPPELLELPIDSAEGQL
ncbi:MAG: DUF3450 domain-containing protein [Halieaceae bacterium]|jgi:hypothetical protein|nr:DUF3450 domain-containing protein [Halieaceae bacterium]